MPSQVSFAVRDYSNEISNFTINISDVTDVNWTTTNNNIVALRAALNALSIGVIAKETLTAFTNNLSSSLPSNKFAQRESGLRLFYEDTVTKSKHMVTIPCPNLDLVASSGTDEIDLGISVVSAIVNAMELFMVSPAGNPVNFYRGVIVGRRN